MNATPAVGHATGSWTYMPPDLWRPETILESWFCRFREVIESSVLHAGITCSDSFFHSPKSYVLKGCS